MGVPPFYPDPYSSAIAAVYGGKKVYDFYFAPGGKMPRPIPPYRRIPRKRRFMSGNAPGVWDGKFKGPIDKSRNNVLRSGYAETHIQTGTVNQRDTAYLGIASYPSVCGNPDREAAGDQAYRLTDYGRAYVDVWIAILRYFFRNYHPGKIEFNSPDQNFDQLSDWTSSNKYTENIYIKFGAPDGSNTESADGAGDDKNFFEYFNSLGATAATYPSLRKLAEGIADSTMYHWKKDGLVPLAMSMRSFIALGGTPATETTVSQSTMWLKQAIVHCRVKTVMVVQNQTRSDDTDATDAGFKNAMTDISCNPLRGKLYYFNDIGPKLATGYDLGADADHDTYADDEWFAYHMTKPIPGDVNGSWLNNVYYTTSNPLGCWQVPPPKQYFKNCRKVINVSLNPGHIKSFKISFNFHGTIENWLKCERTGFDMDQETYQTSTSDRVKGLADYKGMGTCAVLALEKRIRFGDQAVQLQWQCTTHISTNFTMRRRNVMTRDVYTSAD